LHSKHLEKDGEDNQKVGKVSWIVSQAPTPRPKHDKIWIWWVSDIMSKNMLERVWWCKHFEMEFWNQTICCPMSYSKGKRNVHVGGDKKSQATSKYCWKGKVLLSTCAKASRTKGRWLTINLVIGLCVMKVDKNNMTFFIIILGQYL